MQHKQIKAIQALRGIAALLVCIMHILSNQPPSDRWVVLSQRIMQSIGHFGVDLFFTISGFIMAWIVMKEVALPSVKSGFIFILKRFFRIYPLYWFTLLLMFGLSFVNNGFITDEAYQLLNYHIIFLLTSFVPLQYAAWTLGFELYFYIIVSLFICFFRRNYFLYFFTVWGVFQLFVIILNACHLLSSAWGFWGNYLILEFYFGLLIGYCLYHFNKYALDKYILIVVGFLLFLFQSILIYKGYLIPNWIVFLLQCGSASLIVYGCVGLEQCGKIKVSKLMESLGDVSYSVYLWTFPVLGITSYINQEFAIWGAIPPLLRGGISVLMVVLISFVSYRWIERSFIVWSHKLAAYMK